MSRLPTDHDDRGTWGAVLNDYLTKAAGIATMASSPSAGATTFDLALIPPGLIVGSIVAIDAYTTQCELRFVSNISGNTVTVGALKYAHAAGDTVLLVGREAHTEWFGITAAVADQWSPMQRLLKESGDCSLRVRGGFATYYVAQPLVVNTNGQIDTLRLRSLTGFAPVEDTNALLMVGNGQNFFTATASDNTFTTPTAHGLSNDITILLNNPYGETMPGNVTSGKVYYVKSTPTGTTFTLSATLGGAELDVTSDGAGYAVDNPGDGLARVSWESVYVTLTIADLNGIKMALQQPSWTRNTRVTMGAASTAPETTYGLLISGQISYHDNVQVDTHINCTGLAVFGSHVVVRGFSDNGVHNGDIGIRVQGDNHSLNDLWTENIDIGVQVEDTSRGLCIGGSWLHNPAAATDPALKVTGTQTSYSVGTMRVGGTDLLLIDDASRGYQITSNTTGGETDGGLVFVGLDQPYGAVAPRFNHRLVSHTSTDGFVPSRIASVVRMDSTSGDKDVTLPTAVGWLGWQITVANAVGANSVVVGTTSAQTINGDPSVTLAASEAVTVCSDGANYYVVGRG